MKIPTNFTLKVEYSEDSLHEGMWQVTSPEIKGLMVFYTHMYDAIKSVPDAIADMLLADALG